MNIDCYVNGWKLPRKVWKLHPTQPEVHFTRTGQILYVLAKLWKHRDGFYGIRSGCV